MSDFHHPDITTDEERETFFRFTWIALGNPRKGVNWASRWRAFRAEYWSDRYVTNSVMWSTVELGYFDYLEWLKENKLGNPTLDDYN